MMRRRLFFVLLFVLALTLWAVTACAQTLDLTQENFDSVDALAQRIEKEGAPDRVDLTGVKLKTAQRLELMERFPDTHFLWKLDVFGRPCDSEQTVLNMAWKKPTDYQEFVDLLRCLPKLTQVDMWHLFVTRDNMALLTETFPQIKFGFTFKMMEYTIRTDATSFSSLKDGTPPLLKSEHVKVFKYCKDMLALDLGHNALDNLDFLYDMPQLKILILACNNITDITPIASLKNLEYLEIFKNPITDVSALKGLDKLIDLNVANLKITDISPLYGLTQLERLWLPLNKGVSQEQIDQLVEALPNTLITYKGSGSTENGWRVHTRYKIIYRTFHYGSYLPWDAPPLK